MTQVELKECREIEMEEEGVMASEMGIFMIFCALFVGQLIHMFTHRFHIPYTPALTVLGVILGAIDRSIYPKIEDKKLLEEASYTR